MVSCVQWHQPPWMSPSLTGTLLALTHIDLLVTHCGWMLITLKLVPDKTMTAMPGYGQETLLSPHCPQIVFNSVYYILTSFLCRNGQSWKWAELEMGRAGNGQSWKWAELEMGRAGNGQSWKWVELASGS